MGLYFTDGENMIIKNGCTKCGYRYGNLTRKDTIRCIKCLHENQISTNGGK